jgi:pimeloyl-ACP methyl ester carboxylesterase
MPYTISNGTKLWWEEMGTGEPVLAIMGLSFPLEMWHRTAPALARNFRVILFDNRGVGRSDVPRGPYSIPMMARDAAAVMDAAGLASAHIVGASMGGMIAQELALMFPERVRSLVLGCTWCGGLRAVRPNLRAMPDMRNYHRMTPEEKIRLLVPVLYAPTTPAERIEEDMAIRLRNFPSAKGYYSQLLGTLVWSSFSRLERIHQPVLLLHGDMDRLIPVENARILAKRLPDCRTCIVPNAGHVFTTDQPRLANERATEFLLKVIERTENGQHANVAARLKTGTK